MEPKMEQKWNLLAEGVLSSRGGGAKQRGGAKGDFRGAKGARGGC